MGVTTFRDDEIQLKVLLDMFCDKCASSGALELKKKKNSKQNENPINII